MHRLGNAEDLLAFLLGSGNDPGPFRGLVGAAALREYRSRQHAEQRAGQQSQTAQDRPAFHGYLRLRAAAPPLARLADGFTGRFLPFADAAFPAFFLAAGRLTALTCRLPTGLKK